jgi:hypothetical protein
MSLRWALAKTRRFQHAGSVLPGGRPSFVTLRPALPGLTGPETRLAWTHREIEG